MSTLAIVLLTAVIVFVVMFVLQNATSGERKLDYRIEPVHVDDPTFARAMTHLLGPPLVAGNRVQPLLNGDEIFPAMLAAIRAAKQSITLETYIYWSGKIGAEFTEALAERAKVGVPVHVLLDWVGSDKLDSTLLQQMQDAGVQVEKYQPLRWYNLSRLNNRTHRKILVVDGRVGFIGGVGIADEWLGHAQSPDNWRDSHFQVEGPVVADLQAGFLDNWIKTRADVLSDDRYFPPLEPAGDTLAQVFKSSPREGSNSARLMFLMSIEAARERILIANSYFVPDDRSVAALVAAAERGVAVEIIVPNHHTDMPLARRASRARWGPLLEAGIAIFEYQPTMFHCKVMVVDDRWTSVGSANFDNRSFRLNDEANLNVLDQSFAAQQAQIFSADREKAKRISLAEWKHRPHREKLKEHLAALFRSQL
jgi:cardiolipin synthase A/B